MRAVERVEEFFGAVVDTSDTSQSAPKVEIAGPCTHDPLPNRDQIVGPCHGPGFWPPVQNTMQAAVIPSQPIHHHPFLRIALLDLTARAHREGCSPP